MKRQPAGGYFRFGEFELDVSAYAVRRRGQRIKLEKIPMELLILLVGSAGTLVDRKTVHAVLWGADVYVDRDSAINTAVRKIRQALSDSVDPPRFIETVVGKGYRFIAPVEGPTGESGVGGDETHPAPSDDDRGFPRYRLTRGKQEFVLEPGDNLLGRNPEAHVYVDHASVSRRHACISIRSARATIEDLESRNGTFLDGRRIGAPTEIRSGSLVGLGPIALTFVVISCPASTRPMSEGAVTPVLKPTPS